MLGEVEDAVALVVEGRADVQAGPFGAGFGVGRRFLVGRRAWRLLDLYRTRGQTPLARHRVERAAQGECRRREDRRVLIEHALAQEPGDAERGDLERRRARARRVSIAGEPHDVALVSQVVVEGLQQPDRGVVHLVEQGARQLARGRLADVLLAVRAEPGDARVRGVADRRDDALERLGHFAAPRHSLAVTETWRQAWSETPGTSSSRSPVSVSDDHSFRRTTSLPSRETANGSKSWASSGSSGAPESRRCRQR